MNDRFPINGRSKPLPKSGSAEFEGRNTVLRTKTKDRLDRLTALWREMEKKLVGLQPPHEAYHVYDEVRHFGSDNRLNAIDCTCIGIAKYAGKWRVCIGEFVYEETEGNGIPITWRPITDCDKEERIKAARYVKDLEQRILETGEKMLPKLDEAIMHLEVALADI
jgi:hypothetical protein